MSCVALHFGLHPRLDPVPVAGILVHRRVHDLQVVEDLPLSLVQNSLKDALQAVEDGLRLVLPVREQGLHGALLASVVCGGRFEYWGEVFANDAGDRVCVSDTQLGHAIMHLVVVDLFNDQAGDAKDPLASQLLVFVFDAQILLHDVEDRSELVDPETRRYW